MPTQDDCKDRGADAEIARLRGLIARYVEHVGGGAGIDFLGPNHSSDVLTDAEMAEIRRYDEAFQAARKGEG